MQAKGPTLLLDSNWRVESTALAGSRTPLKTAALRAKLGFLASAESAAVFGPLGSVQYLNSASLTQVTLTWTSPSSMHLAVNALRYAKVSAAARATNASHASLTLRSAFWK
jgi:hypothetical protein